MNNQSSDESPSKPVAYDHMGRPLYLHPPTAEQPSQSTEPSSADSTDITSHVTAASDNSTDGHNFDPALRSQYANEPHVVHATRPLEPEAHEVSDTVRAKHEASKKKYPFLNLSDCEFVVLNLQRHPIGMFTPIAVASLSLLALLVLLIIYPADSASLPSFWAVFWPILALMTMIGVGCYIAIWVYLQNQFFMTNESVIQEIQHGLFSRHEQTVSLGSVEDVSFKKTGLLQTFLDYGTIRMSTEGEETTYRFHYVSRPKQQTAILNNAVEAFKNGRPVQDAADKTEV